MWWCGLLFCGFCRCKGKNDYCLMWFGYFPSQVWSLVRRFDQPQKYKPFVSRCIMQGDLGIGSVREVNVKSGLPATTSTERLEQLDDEEHILGIRIVGGDHRLRVWSIVLLLIRFYFCIIRPWKPNYCSFLRDHNIVYVKC